MNLEENPLKKQEATPAETEIAVEDLVIDPEKMKEVQKDLTESVEKAQIIGENIAKETNPEKRQSLIERYSNVLKKIETVIQVGAVLGAVYVTGQELDVLGAISTPEDIKMYATNTEKMTTQLKAVGSILGSVGSGFGAYFLSSWAMNLFKKKEAGNDKAEV